MGRTGSSPTDERRPRRMALRRAVRAVVMTCRCSSASVRALADIMWPNKSCSIGNAGPRIQQQNRFATDSPLEGNGIRTSGPLCDFAAQCARRLRLGPIKFRGYPLPRDPDRFTLRQADRAGEAYAQVMEKLEFR
jgi:hypothetical protein